MREPAIVEVAVMRGNTHKGAGALEKVPRSGTIPSPQTAVVITYVVQECTRVPPDQPVPVNPGADAGTDGVSSISPLR